MLRHEFYSKLEKFNERQNEKESLSHSGIKGQKWGVRRWQYEDGRFNEAGKERYFGKTAKKERREEKRKRQSKLSKKAWNAYPLNFTDYDDSSYMSDRDWKYVK